MSHRIRLHPSGHEYEAATGEPLLEAGLRAGLNLAYRCDNGSCGECRARVMQGQVQTLRAHDFHLSEAERAAGHVLLCSTGALSGLQLEARESGSIADVPVQVIRTQVRQLQRPQPDLLLLQLRTPRSQTLQFLAGQNARLTLPDGSAHVLPIASCPCNGMVLEFHLRRGAGTFSEAAFSRLAAGDSVIVTGPCGRLTLDEQSPRRSVFIAYDTGFAAIKSLIEHAIALERPQPMHFYWIGCAPGEHYLLNYCRSWEDALDNFHFTPLCATAEWREPGRGDAVCEDLLAQMQACPAQAPHEGLADCDVYLAGVKPMVDCAARSLLTRGLPLCQLHAQALGEEEVHTVCAA
jgi:CDP-4-dehydro-6-deoxyglucose reductase